MAKSLSPTQRTLRELRARGLECAMVERWLAGPKLRQDLFGIIDMIALGPDGVIGVQSCGDSFAAHYQKITVERYQETHNWLSTPGCTLELWSWRKVKVRRGGRAEIWQPRIAA